MRTILITCGGGLGNRLLGLASAMVLAKRCDADLKVCWPVGGPTDTGTAEGFFCPFTALFKPLFPLIPLAERNHLLCDSHQHYSLVDQKGKNCEVADQGLTYYYTHGAIRGQASGAELHTALESLKPVQAVRDVVSGARLKLADDYDGMLVRCKGHPKARKWKAGARFKAALFKMTPRGPSSIYMACDDHDTAMKLAANDERLVILPRPWQLNSAAELIVVAAEIILLQASTVFYATPFCALTELIRTLRSPEQPLVYPE